MPETSQQQADRLLAADQQRRALAMRPARCHRDSVSGIQGVTLPCDACDAARPVLGPLTGFDRFEERARVRFGVRSRASQVRDALLTAFQNEPDGVRGNQGPILLGVQDETLKALHRPPKRRLTDIKVNAIG